MCQCPEKALGDEPGPLRHFNPSYFTVYLGHDLHCSEHFPFLLLGALTGTYLVFVFSPYLVPVGAGRPAVQQGESRRLGIHIPTTAWPPWSPRDPLPKTRLKFLSAEVAVC